MTAEHTYCQQCGAAMLPSDRRLQPCVLCRREAPRPNPPALYALEKGDSIRVIPDAPDPRDQVEQLVMIETREFQDAEDRVAVFRIGIKRHTWRDVVRDRISHAEQQIGQHACENIADLWAAVY